MSAAPWLDFAKTLLGTHEAPGTADNPIILKWSDAIAEHYPQLRAYSREYVHDSIPWCGDFVAYCMSMTGFRPVMKTDGATYGYLWADDWKFFGMPCQPKEGAVMVFTRNGGGHVAFYLSEDVDHYTVLGGNQSDAVTITRMPKAQFTAARWPKGARSPPVPAPAPPPAMPEAPVDSGSGMDEATRTDYRGPPVNDWHPEPPLPDDPGPGEAPPLQQEPWTLTKAIGAVISAGGASALAFINSPYALAALVMLLVFGFFIFREWQRKRK